MSDRKRKAALKAFDLNDKELSPYIKENALASGGYPYSEKLKRQLYEDQLIPLQIELLKLQSAFQKSGERLVVIFEGRDTAGKGGTISRFRQHLNPRHAHIVALTKPTEAEQGQWYFQRYIAHLPTAGDIALFDRSWYNRAGVEPVMGFCTPEQHKLFLQEVPHFEARLVNDGIHLIKIWLTIGQEMQLYRLYRRKHDALKHWKISPIDLKAIEKWDAYTDAKEQMFRATHQKKTPWTVILSNDKKRARIAALKLVLHQLNYEGKDETIVTPPDPKICGSGDGILFNRQT